MRGGYEEEEEKEGAGSRKTRMCCIRGVFFETRSVIMDEVVHRVHGAFALG